jgi:hypothetical protein
MPQAESAQKRLKVASAPPSYGQVSSSSEVHRREGHLASVQMKLLTFTQSFCSSAECSSPAATTPDEFFSCCDSVASPQAAVWAPTWAPRLSTYNAQQAAPRATASAPRSSTCDAQGTAPRATAWAPRSSTCDKQLPRATAWPLRSSTWVARRCGHRPGHRDYEP